MSKPLPDICVHSRPLKDPRREELRQEQWALLCCGCLLVEERASLRNRDIREQVIEHYFDQIERWRILRLDKPDPATDKWDNRRKHRRRKTDR